MNKIANVVYSGWMVKSPPEKKFRLTGAWKIFRAKWKRRFFVLFKPEGSLPHQYVLNYYSDEQCKKPKGYIDLEHCEQIIESLDLDLYPFLLAIKTYHKNKERTYFLATDTEEQMTTWVRNLCSVCGLKPEDDSSDLPDQRHEPLESVKPAAPPTQNVVTPAVTSTTITKQPEPIPLRTGKGREQDGEEYIPISECRSHPVRQDSVNSIPDEPAPPPPDKMGANFDLDNEVFHPSTYDTPKSRDQVDSVYKVPPPRIKRNSKEEATLDVYDIPPTRQSPSTPRSSSSESQKADSAYSSQSGLGQTYDYPPSHNDRNLSVDDVYDVPPPNPQSVPDNTPPPRPGAPPGRPPKPTLHQEQYQNLPRNSKAVQDSTANGWDLNRVVPPTPAEIGIGSYDIPKAHSAHSTASMYDMPKPAAGNVNILSSSVPAPQSCGYNKRQHNYLNAAKGYVSNTPKRSDTEDNYLPMDGADSGNSSSNKTSNETYLDMTHNSHHNPQDDYDTPPPPVRPPPRSKTAQTTENGDTYQIFSTARTRSFKRHGSPQIGSRPDGHRPKPAGAIELPSRVDNCHPDCSTSSEDEDEQYLIDPSQVMMGYYMGYYSHNHSQGKSGLWTKTPPAPRLQEDLKYLDLDLQEGNDEPRKSPSCHTGDQSTPTDYKEIDFVKTSALASIKRDLGGEKP